MLGPRPIGTRRIGPAARAIMADRPRRTIVARKRLIEEEGGGGGDSGPAASRSAPEKHAKKPRVSGGQRPHTGSTCACPDPNCDGKVAYRGNYRKNCSFRKEHGLRCQPAENKVKGDSAHLRHRKSGGKVRYRKSADPRPPTGVVFRPSRA